MEHETEILTAPWPPFQLLCFRLRPPGGVNKPVKKWGEKKEEKTEQARQSQSPFTLLRKSHADTDRVWSVIATCLDLGSLLQSCHKSNMHRIPFWEGVARKNSRESFLSFFAGARCHDYISFLVLRTNGLSEQAKDNKILPQKTCRCSADKMILRDFTIGAMHLY